MTKLAIVNNVTKMAKRSGLKFKKHSPEILVVSGVVGVVASAVMACKATTKLDDVLSESKDQVNKIHEVMENPDMIPEGKEYTEEDGKKDLAIVYTQSALKVAKLYAPSVILGTASIAAILGGHNILRKRNIALATAYTALNTSFKDYRNRVIERFGKELDKELRFNIKSKEIEEVVKDENGNETVEKKNIQIVDGIDGYSPYARFYDDGCAGWEKNPELNLMFLRRQQDAANEVLKRQGYLFLNDVYEMLGIPRSSAGQIVGWIYDEKNPVGDNRVDFGMYDANKPQSGDFVNGYVPTIILDFNVDGDILNLI